MAKRFPKSSKMILAVWAFSATVFFLSPPIVRAETAAEVIKALDAFKANPSKLNALKVLRYSADIDQLRKTGQIPRSYDGALWEVDDIKVDMLHQKLSETGGKMGSGFQMSIYGSDSVRPPTRTQLQAANPGMSEAELTSEIERLRGATRYDVFRSDFDMCFTGPDARAAADQVLKRITFEFQNEGIPVDVSRDLGFNALSYPTVPGGGFDLRVKYVANQEMYNSRAGIKWINRNICNNGVITYWDAEAGRMVTQKITEYSGRVPLPFTKPGPIGNDELFGFLADNWNQLRHHLQGPLSDAQRLQWIEKYLSRSLNEYPESMLNTIGLSANERQLLQTAKAVRESGDADAIRKHVQDMYKLYQDVMSRNHAIQMDLIAAQIEKNVKLGVSMSMDQKLRLLISDLAGTYQNIGIDRARALLEQAARAAGKDSLVYKALFTALEQAKDLKDEAAILAELEKILATGAKPVKITRPSEPGKPAEVKIEDPYQKRAFEQALKENVGDEDFADAAEFAKKYPNSGPILTDRKLFSEKFEKARAAEIEELARARLAAKTPEEAEKIHLRLRRMVLDFVKSEVNQSQIVRHRMWLQLDREVKNSWLYTRSMFAELGTKMSSLEGAVTTVKGVILRHKLITSLLFISAAYGWYQNGAWGAVEALWESGKSIAIYEAINWMCFTGAKKLAQITGLSALGPVGWAIGVIYNVYEIGKLAVMLNPIIINMMNRAVDTLVFGSASDLNAKRFYYGGTYKSYLTGEMESPGFFDSLWGFNKTERGIVKDPKDLFPIFATPEELLMAIDKEWTDGAVGQKWYHMFGSLTQEKMRELALADWQTSFTLKFNEYLQNVKADNPRDEDLERYDRMSADESNRKWTELYGRTTAMILGLTLKPETPKAGEDVEASCDYVVLGLPGQDMTTKLVLRVKSPSGESSESKETETKIGEDAVTAEDRTDTITVANTFKMEDKQDLARTVFIAELYDYEGRLLDRMEIRAGLLATTIETKVSRAGTDPTTNDWTIDLTVKDSEDKAVDSGEIKIETDKGEFEGRLEWEGPLTQGTKTLLWKGPADKAEKAKVKITYFGDERDPAKPDKKYAECEKSIELPPNLLETKITVVLAPAPSSDKNANDWTLEIKVHDLNEKAVTAGFLTLKTDIGGLDTKGKTEWDGELQGGTAKVTWLGSKDLKDKATVEIKYLGDEKDPAVLDKIYAESRTSVQVPPDALETKIEIQSKPAKPDPAANEWKIDVLVQDANGAPVLLGDLKAEAADGGIEKIGALEWTGTLKDGKAQVTWFGPPDRKKKVLIKFTYLGDESDPTVPDVKYKESEATIELPRALATEVEYKVSPIPKEPRNWEIETKVKDELGGAVKLGDVKIETTEGSLDVVGAQISGGKLEDVNGVLKNKFFGPNDPKKKAKIVITYLGDQADPQVPDDIYKDSEKSFSLPPELALTTLEVKVNKVDPNNQQSNDWAMSIEVKEESGAYVALGDLELTCDEGALETKGQTKWTGSLSGGKATVKWLGPDDLQKKATVTIAYLGDQKDPALPDLKYEECRKTLRMPPLQLKPTTVNITPSLVDEKKKIWKLEVEVKDDKGAPVTKGAVRFMATGGSFKEAGTVLDVQMTLQSGKYTKGWKQTDDDVQTIRVAYTGDETDPAKEDVLYEESEAAVKLPPEQLEKSTVFVIDASGSMGGAKLASAKEAVRTALSGYMGKENKEEWALYAFFDCGSIQLLQGFTRDPARVTAQLGFDASGSTPIAASIRAARGYLLRAARGKTGRIILLSDGGENCSGTPVEEAKSIRVRTLTVDLSK
jgi:Mg-chelatase subunit ChlD